MDDESSPSEPPPATSNGSATEEGFTDEELGRAKHPYYRVSILMLAVPLGLLALFFNQAFTGAGLGGGIALLAGTLLLLVAGLTNCLVASIRAAQSPQPPPLAGIVAGVAGVALAAILFSAFWLVGMF